MPSMYKSKCECGFVLVPSDYLPCSKQFFRGRQFHHTSEYLLTIELEDEGFHIDTIHNETITKFLAYDFTTGRTCYYPHDPSLFPKGHEIVFQEDLEDHICPECREKRIKTVYYAVS